MRLKSELTLLTTTTGMRRSHATTMAREDVVGDLAPFVGYGGHDRLCPLDRSLRDGRPLTIVKTQSWIDHRARAVIILSFNGYG
ncbi:hypothetical protein [Candidatus Nitrospira nitrosa]|uniref:hypothetical protein n=1 Tax=Candidatus Nitrospira nitrosa TaxID=1742972 RepID=UPI000B80865F|nr:hypothetical protein [Candidatus Nitrospira nitrosa]